jgi:Inovirus Gp2
MQINPHNRNQTLLSDYTYLNLPIMFEKGPMILEYLDALHGVIQKSLSAHKRVCAMRFDLRYPLSMGYDAESFSNEAISRFIESLKAKIRHDRSRARLERPYSHNTDVRYVWARELSREDRVHYHVALLVNRDAYFTLGKFKSSEQNMAGRIIEAWASALRLTPTQAEGLVHFPDNAVYRFELEEPQQLQAFFHRASYLCKVSSKQFGNGQHGFGASRH